MRVVLVEPFYGGSHRAWADGYAAHSGHDVHLVTHDDAAWRWRLRGGSLTLADDLAATVAAAGRPDVVLVSDMVNLPALLGFARRSVGDAPVAAYFHENQLLYSVEGGGGPDRQLGLVNWLTLAAADLVLFNSAHHRDGLMAELPGFLREVADDGHLRHLEAVAGRSEVVPVGVDLAGLTPDRRPALDGGAPLILWNHRWEWDKQIGPALGLLHELARQGVDFRVALVGEQPERLSAAVRRSVADLGDRVVVEGHLPRDEYVELLLRSDVVLSMATQEFFGIAMVEAIAAGCVPVLPDGLSYPEVIPSPWHDVALHDRSGTGPGDHLRSVLTDLHAARRAVDGLAATMQRFDWSALAPVYDERLERLALTGA
jgi:glycosyltransferase involved in cell wall biosynthesis